MVYVFENTLNGKVALVTGASRGIGKGIAKILVESGAKVYITGRESSAGDNNVQTVAEELNKMGPGQCLHIFCDHSVDEQVKSVFKKIEEDNGKLDLLVNNAFGGVKEMAQVKNKKFYELEPEFWDQINNVGLRSNYYCANLAAKIMVPKKDGLIVNISSFGGIMSLFNVAYSVGKEGNDRMAYEMARDLRKENVCCVSLWPGLVKTEAMNYVVEKNPNGIFAKSWHLAEETTFSGKAVAALLADKSKMKVTGKTLIVAELAEKYGFFDVGDFRSPSIRSAKFMIEYTWKGSGSFMPSFIKLPGWFYFGYYNRF